MIEGTVNEDGMPLITMLVAGRSWTALIDTGFNGDLELPEELRSHLEISSFGPIESRLAAGQSVMEQAYFVTLPFDGRDVLTLATFAPSDRILIGTHLLRNHTLTIDFPAGEVRIERSTAI